ncbi:cyclopropane-fatty-acyl-phospholipid synthase [Vibrio sp. 10N.286.49.B3]|uniref:SAM-dependent methyltransferase n=1 Tax=Vibrio sp. 10N.286.49.B3 TaxID=1880855 RepID=UPI000C83C12C|nr:cyclopropane-fatty-acyl-phospholipid synthase family protein [Vibrio sp. 10N.286.49.B3]PMH46761.1 cyclopropane-fatty-acyl-phospholipid synthase [Vibrio sp. 10N.286.49.B3]
MLNTPSIALPIGLTHIQKTARTIAFKCLEKLEHGHLTLIENYDVPNQDAKAQRTERFGLEGQSGIGATIEVKHPEFYRRLLQGGSIAAGESYIDGWWDTPNLTQLMELMALNMTALDKIESKSSIMTKLVYKVSHWFNRNTIDQSEENIHAHYDLGNTLYNTFLDSNMLYSSALYLSAEDDLEQAQINKMERLCQQLKLNENDSVIEIGTGWGAMAIYMATKYNCQVTTTTISDEQYAYTENKIRQLGLEQKITLLKKDYRLLEGTFDKLVSIEMIEAVGREFLPSYVDKCQSLLKPGGLMAIQAITIADQRYQSYSNSVDFIQKYIFPGGFLPSISALLQQTSSKSDLVLRDLHDIGLDYAKTLQQWQVTFNQAEQLVQKLGYDEQFIRMWRYYFSYCEGGFRAKRISAVQMTFERPFS